MDVPQRRGAEICMEEIETMGEHSFLLKLHLEQEAFLRQTIDRLQQRICEETNDKRKRISKPALELSTRESSSLVLISLCDSLASSVDYMEALEPRNRLSGPEYMPKETARVQGERK